MTDDDESYCKHLTDPENGYRCILGLQTSSEKCAGDFSIRCDQRAIISVENRVPSSTELIAMANLEWKNREEHRGIHNREDWCCGWMAGFLSEKKPNWTKEQIYASEKRGYERALDDLGVLHGEDARKFNEELENPSPMTPEAAEVMRKARALANETFLCSNSVHDDIAKNARKEMAKTISEILDHEWMCSLNEIKYILDCVANGNTDPFKDRPEKGVEK